MPQVSVIMTVQNQEGRVGRSLESVLSQTFRDFEFIIVDDCSSDGTLGVLERYSTQDSRIVVIKNERGLGIAKSVNRAFKRSQGSYIARIDSDDAWIDNTKLELQVEFLQSHPDYVAVGGGMVVVDAGGIEVFRYLKPEHDADIRKTALLTNPIANSTSLCRRSAIGDSGLGDETLPASEDWDFWLRMGTRGKLYNVPLYFSYYTMTGDNHSLENVRANSLIGMKIVNRYKKHYPHYVRGMVVNIVQYMYGCVPYGARRMWNPIFSGYKKIMTGSRIHYPDSSSRR